MLVDKFAYLSNKEDFLANSMLTISVIDPVIVKQVKFT